MVVCLISALVHLYLQTTHCVSSGVCKLLRATNSTSQGHAQLARGMHADVTNWLCVLCAPLERTAACTASAYRTSTLGNKHAQITQPMQVHADCNTTHADCNTTHANCNTLRSRLPLSSMQNATRRGLLLHPTQPGASCMHSLEQTVCGQHSVVCALHAACNRGASCMPSSCVRVGNLLAV